MCLGGGISLGRRRSGCVPLPTPPPQLSLPSPPSATDGAILGHLERGHLRFSASFSLRNLSTSSPTSFKSIDPTLNQQPSLCGLVLFLCLVVKAVTRVCVAWFERKVSAICLRDAEHDVSSSSQRAKAFQPRCTCGVGALCVWRSLREVLVSYKYDKSWKKLFCFRNRSWALLQFHATKNEKAIEEGELLNAFPSKVPCSSSSPSLLR